MSNQTVLLEEDTRGIATLTMNRPDACNALDGDMISSFAETLAILDKKPEIRAVVITGAGACFSAGVDITWMEHMMLGSPGEDARRLAHLLLTVKNLNKPTLALIDGVCFGAGIALTASCDIAITTEEAIFALPAVHLGAVSAIVAPFVTEAIGPRMTKRFLLTGERFSSEKAKEIQLVHSICMRAQLADTADEIIQNLLLGAPNAILASKEMLHEWQGRTLNQHLIEEAARLTTQLCHKPEAREGVAAFIEKRTPNWYPKD